MNKCDIVNKHWQQINDIQKHSLHQRHKTSIIYLIFYELGLVYPIRCHFMNGKAYGVDNHNILGKSLEIRPPFAKVSGVHQPENYN